MSPKLIARLTFWLVLLVSATSACNQAVCGSIVSKCLLTENCKCDMKTCSCCKECFFCLSYLYDECCSCVDLCPKRNATTRNPLSAKSHVEELGEPVPGLFQALTVDPDPRERWRSFSFPVDFDVSVFETRPELIYHLAADSRHRSTLASRRDATIVTLNCTVAYIAQCSSWNKCQITCQSMGAASYRWFHNGCCECVGDTCINYGINESRCRLCPLVNRAADYEYDDYGQEDDDDAEDNLEDYLLDELRN